MSETNFKSPDELSNHLDSLIEDNNRINNSFGDLIGKQFIKGDVIPMKYNTPDGNIMDYEFDTTTNKIIIKERIFSVKPLEGTIISKVEFTDNKVIIYGKMGIIDGKMEATYIKTLEAIDEIYLYISKNNK